MIAQLKVNTHGENSLELPLLPQGLYFIQIYNTDYSETLKWICE
jgi:hypothetical protein